MALARRRCAICRKSLNGMHGRAKVCSDECAKKRKYKMRYEDCPICGDIFFIRQGSATTCEKKECRRAYRQMRRRAYAERQAELEAVELEKQKQLALPDIVMDGELLGPEEPDMPKRKCHEKGCNEMTYDYRCDKCRMKWRAKNRASGLSGITDLFSGGYIPQQGSGVCYG